MKTLIIHPADPSTSFLDIVYAPIENKTVITGGVSKTEVQQLKVQVIMAQHAGSGATAP